MALSLDCVTWVFNNHRRWQLPCSFLTVSVSHFLFLSFIFMCKLLLCVCLLVTTSCHFCCPCVSCFFRSSSPHASRLGLLYPLLFLSSFLSFMLELPFHLSPSFCLSINMLPLFLLRSRYCLLYHLHPSFDGLSHLSLFDPNFSCPSKCCSDSLMFLSRSLHHFFTFFSSLLFVSLTHPHCHPDTSLLVSSCARLYSPGERCALANSHDSMYAWECEKILPPNNHLNVKALSKLFLSSLFLFLSPSSPSTLLLLLFLTLFFSFASLSSTVEVTTQGLRSRLLREKAIS